MLSRISALALTIALFAWLPAAESPAQGTLSEDDALELGAMKRLGELEGFKPR
jgi:hypothetical protein